jgi:redox-sensitive bicupin YhaK (pirin superfamily)
VRPHPHINLATVTYLFEGVIRHQDSLGSDQLIEPGAINWMTAGKGIVHSERTPESAKSKGTDINGIQLWVALPNEFEEIDPSFSHHPKETLPELKIGDAHVKLLLGSCLGGVSPVPVHSDLFYAEIKLPADSTLSIPADGRESAIYVVKGQLEIDGHVINVNEMAVSKTGIDLPILAKSNAHFMILGGSPVGERFIYWNFVSSSKERLEEAKSLWARGPHAKNPRFLTIPGDNNEFIPLPIDT